MKFKPFLISVSSNEEIVNQKDYLCFKIKLEKPRNPQLVYTKD
jgi:hypothetical protein